MTRKRFVRLLMAHRYQRNEAEQIARKMQKQFGSYAAAWELEVRDKAGFHFLLAKMVGVKKATKNVDAVAKAASKIGAAMAAMFKVPQVVVNRDWRNDRG